MSSHSKRVRSTDWRMFEFLCNTFETSRHYILPYQKGLERAINALYNASETCDVDGILRRYELLYKLLVGIPNTRTGNELLDTPDYNEFRQEYKKGFATLLTYPERASLSSVYINISKVIDSTIDELDVYDGLLKPNFVSSEKDSLLTIKRTLEAVGIPQGFCKLANETPLRLR